MKKCVACGKTVSSAKMMFCPDCGGTLTEVSKNTPVVPVAAPQEVTGFCTYCGTRFNEFGVCAQCGNLSTRQNKVLNKPEPYGKKLLECFRAMFSSSPFNGIENAGRETASTIWPICGGAFVLFVSLAVAGILSGFAFAGEIKGMKEAFTLAAFTGVGSSFFGAFAKVLLTAAALFFASAAMLWLPMKLSGESVSYVQLMNVNSFALLPVTLSAFAAFIASFISARFALFLLPVGAFMSVIMLYYAIQKLARFKASPFWCFAGALLGDSVICYLCLFTLGKLFA